MIYEYQCIVCKRIHEEIRPVTDADVRFTKCPHCGRMAQKIISQTAKPKTGFSTPTYPGVDYPGPAGEKETLDDMYRGRGFRDGQDGAEDSQEQLAKRKDTLKQAGFGDVEELGCEPEKKITVGG